MTPRTARRVGTAALMTRPLGVVALAVASALALAACTSAGSAGADGSHAYSYTLTPPEKYAYGDAPEPQAPSEGNPIRFTLGGLPTGPGSEIAHYSDAAIGGVTVPGLGHEDRVMSFAHHGDGWAVAVFNNETIEDRTLIIDANGAVTDTYPGKSGWAEVAANSGGSVAYATSGDTVRLDDASGAEAASWTVTGMTQPHVLALTDDGDVVVSAKVPSAYGTFIFHDDGSAPDQFWGVDAWAADANALAEPFGPNPYRCATVWDVPDHAQRWVRCGIQVISMSPDGTHMAALGGKNDRDLVIVDAATGHDVTRFANPTRGSSWFRRDVAWEDATHILAFVFKGGTYTAVRLGVDGSAELVDGLSDLPSGWPAEPVWDAAPPASK